MIPTHIIEEHKKGVEKLTFYGVPVIELDRDGLLAFANLCAQSLKEQHERFIAFVDTSRELSRVAEPASREFQNAALWGGITGSAKVEGRRMGESKTDSGESVAIYRGELERLLAIEQAAQRFDKAGCMVNQMNREQWAAYTELKSLFHGGIAYRT